MYVYLYVSVRKGYVYQCIQLQWMQSSSVRVVYWKRQFLCLPFHKEISQSRQGQDQIFRVHMPLLRRLRDQEHKYLGEAARGKAETPAIPVLCLQRKPMFLYSLLKSAANALLKLMSAVIAIADVLFVSLKSPSVNFMLIEYSFGKLKYDPTTFPMSGF